LKPKYHEFQLGAERALIEKNSIEAEEKKNNKEKKRKKKIIK